MPLAKFFNKARCYKCNLFAISCLDFAKILIYFLKEVINDTKIYRFHSQNRCFASKYGRTHRYFRRRAVFKKHFCRPLAFTYKKQLDSQNGRQHNRIQATRIRQRKLPQNRWLLPAYQAYFCPHFHAKCTRF